MNEEVLKDIFEDTKTLKNKSKFPSYYKKAFSEGKHKKIEIDILKKEVIKHFYNEEFIKSVLSWKVKLLKYLLKSPINLLWAKIFANDNKELYNELREQEEKETRERLKAFKEIIKDFENNKDLAMCLGISKNELLNLLEAIFNDKAKPQEIYIKNNKYHNFYALLWDILEETIKNAIDELSGVDMLGIECFSIALSLDEYDLRTVPKQIKTNYLEIFKEIKRLIELKYELQTLEQKDNNHITTRAYKEYDTKSAYSVSALSLKMIESQNAIIKYKENILGNTTAYFTSTLESKKTIENLKPLEKKILDTLVHDFFNNGIRDFTDSQLVREIYGNEDREHNIYKKPTKAQLESINEALEKLRTTFIELEATNEEHAFLLNSRNPFINLTRLGVKNEKSNTQYYRIEGIPFYYSYISRLGKFIDCDKEDYTKTLKGLKNTPKTQDLRLYIYEHTRNALEGLDIPYLSLETIYRMYGIETKKERFDIADKVETILKDLSKKYSFKFTVDKKGKTKKGYKIAIKNAF